MASDERKHLPNSFIPPWGDGYPACEKCRRPADSIEVEAPLDTGERIYTVICHGEIWRWSSFRGAH
jgi:hypothetical protein